ncbi:MAG: COX15/CtaA family protein [Myxococcota bacterium]
MPPVSEHARTAARSAGRAAAVIALLAWCLVVVGALVRAHGAGLSCPDWPLCFGQVIPEFDLKIAFEWGHRVMAGSLTLALVGLAAFVLRSAELRARFRAPLTWIFALLSVQIVLGGLTVLLGLAPWTVTAHLLVGNGFVVSLVWLAHGLFECANPEPVACAELPGALATLGFACAALLVLQLALGGLVASHYAGLACSTFPLCNGDSLAPTLSGQVGLHVVHRLNAYALCFAFGAFALAARGTARIGRLAVVAFGIVLLQIAVGVANVLLRLPIEVTALHSALATALAITTALVVRELLAARRASSVDLPARGGRVLEGAR